MQGGFVFSVRCCMTGYDTLSRRCGSGAGRIAAVARPGVNPTLRVTPLKKCRSFRGWAVGGLPGSDGRGRVTPLFIHNVLDKK